MGGVGVFGGRMEIESQVLRIYLDMLSISARHL